MDHLLYIAATGANDTMLAQAANTHNLANASTAGFRADLVSARSAYMNGAQVNSRTFASSVNTGIEFKQGVVNSTGNDLDVAQIRKIKTAILLELARMDARKNWTQQFHFGALRNTNDVAMQKIGPDTGYDSIGDFEIGKPLAYFFNMLSKEDNLAKTIVYGVNPRDNELLATMVGNYQDGLIPGKMQYGSAWWYNDQKDGMERQINTLSNMGLLSRFVGMLTDSRSFLSYPRHEYFRRIVCNLFGSDVENGELPYDLELIGNTIADICYDNALNYFGISLDQ